MWDIWWNAEVRIGDIIRVAVAQIELVHKDKAKNLENIKKNIKKASEQKADIIAFPEYSYTGYILDDSDYLDLAEDLDGNFINTLKKEAVENNIYIIAGYIEKDKEKLYNSAIFLDNKGNILLNYRKTYLWKKENKYFDSLENYKVIETEFGKVGILICYDMEFPEPARKLGLLGADIVFVPSCFSNYAENRWDIELNANALFNLYYVVGVNVVDKYCCGKSKIINPNGKNLIEASRDKEELLVEDIDFSVIKELREKIPYYNDYKKM